MRKIVSVVAAVLAAVPFAMPAFAQHAQHHAAEASAKGALSQGEVRRIDKDAGKVAINHEAPGMPAMTMVYPVKDAALLDKVNVGDAIRFRAQTVEGRMTVTQLEPARSMPTAARPKN